MKVLMVLLLGMFSFVSVSAGEIDCDKLVAAKVTKGVDCSKLPADKRAACQAQKSTVGKQALIK